MNRRHFITLSLAATTLPSLSLASVSYAPGLVQKHLAAGDTVFLDFKASWCSTCRAQEKVIKRLKSANAAYEQNIVFIDVDWDQFGGSDLVRDLRVPRRSTLIAMNSQGEIGRIVAGTSKKQIQALMDSALSAATS